MGDELTRSRSALMLSGSCSRSRGVSGNSVRLDVKMEKKNMLEEVDVCTNDHLPLTATLKTTPVL